MSNCLVDAQLANLSKLEISDLTTNNFLKDTGYFGGGGLEIIFESISERVRDLGCKSEEQDPYACKSTPEIIRFRGYDVEEHEVVTRDGYILSIFRVINPLIKPRLRPRLKPVLLQHALLSSSNDYVFNSQNVTPAPWPCKGCKEPTKLDPSNDQQHPKSLAYYLANEGYDVWLSNARGNVYGRRHIHLSTRDPKFWDFSWDNQVKFDLPDTIEYIQNYTRFKKLGYVAFSQGTQIMIGLLSEQPHYADIVEPVVLLAPIAYEQHTTSAIELFLPLEPVSNNFLTMFAGNHLIRLIFRDFCKRFSSICVLIAHAILGYDPLGLQFNRLITLLHHVPSGTSWQSFAHYGQGVAYDNFTHYNYGSDENLLRYGQILPPIYNVSRIRSKSIVLVRSESDPLATPKDIETLIKNLRVKLFRDYVVSKDAPGGLFNHAHFCYGQLAGVLVNRRVVKVFNYFRRLAKRFG